MGGITLAWLIGESIIIARDVTKNHRPPVPGALLASSGLFALLAIVAEYPPARTPMTLLAFGVDIAAWLQVPFITPPSAPAQGGNKQGQPQPGTGHPQPQA